ncbi:hypothetical protein HZU77_013545 [Neisseriaceae bacterium TC5R-5]|nr:hypothetical protein [Neisseriaceae bacterium TC5R-5]
MPDVVPDAHPADPDGLAQIELAAHSGAFGCNAQAEPTLAQIQAGNYKKGRFSLFGLPIAIEQPRGTYRTGTSHDGQRWTTRLAAHYGYLVGTQGADGDAVDVFVGSFVAHPVAYVINQVVNGRFDEHKVMLACADEEDARRLYLDSYERGWPGLDSVVSLSIPQLQAWLKHGNKQRPLRSNSLPSEGIDTMTQRIVWDAHAHPYGQSLDQLMYALRRDDGGEGLLLDSLSVQDILDDSEGVLVLDALVTPFARLERKMAMLQTVMVRASEQVKPIAMQVTEPFKQRGVANVATIFELSDGQTVSVFFHNPDVTPNKMASTDELISWKWLLNKKDITIVVAPERGEDLNIREVARRIMRLAEKNSTAFQRQNGKRAERMQHIQALREEITALETELSSAQQALEAAKLAAEEAAAKKEAESNESSAVVATYETGRMNPKTKRWNKDGLLIVSATETAGMYVWRHESSVLRTITNTVEVAYPWLAEVLAGLGDAVAGKTLSEKEVLARVKLKSGQDILLMFELEQNEPSDDDWTDTVSPRIENIANELVALGWTPHRLVGGYALTSPLTGNEVTLTPDPVYPAAIEISGSQATEVASQSPAQVAAAINQDDAESWIQPHLQPDPEAVDDDLDEGVVNNKNSPFHGLPLSFATAALMLQHAVEAKGGVTLWGELNASLKQTSLFDSAAVLGVTAQIGKAGRVYGRAAISEEGVTTLYRGAVGDEALGEAEHYSAITRLVETLFEQAETPPPPAPSENSEPPEFAAHPQMEEYLKKALLRMHSLLAEAQAKGITPLSKEQFMIDVNNGNRLGFSVAKLTDELHDDESKLAGVQAGTVTPRSVIGTGGKKAQAIQWLSEKIADTKLALSEGGFLNTINVGNYNSALYALIHTGKDDGFTSNEDNARQEAERQAESEVARQEQLALEAKAEVNRRMEVGSMDGMREPLEIQYTLHKDAIRVVAELADLLTPEEKYRYLEQKKRDNSDIKSKELAFNRRVDLNTARKKGVTFGYFSIAPRVGYSLVTLVIDLRASAQPEPGERQQAPLPWDSSDGNDESRWAFTELMLTAKDRRSIELGLTREGPATLIYVLNHGKVLQIRWPGQESGIRISTSDYLIDVVKLVDNTEAQPNPAPSTTDPQQDADRALFQSVIDGTVADILAPALADELEAAYLRQQEDTELAALFEQAVNAYQAAMLTATAQL